MIRFLVWLFGGGAVAVAEYDRAAIVARHRAQGAVVYVCPFDGSYAYSYDPDATEWSVLELHRLLTGCRR